MGLSLTVNGDRRACIADPVTPLVDVLREEFHLTGAKPVCREGFCGACMVLVDDRPTPSCLMPAALAQDRQIRTVEGLAKNGELSVLQKAFIEHFSFQCGYCTAGFLNESQVLLERLAKKPVARAELEKTIAEALDGHLCRCTGYVKYHQAVRDVVLADAGRYLAS